MVLLDRYRTGGVLRPFSGVLRGGGVLRPHAETAAPAPSRTPLRAAKSGEVALAGPDGERAAVLLKRSVRDGATVFANVARLAVARLMERGQGRGSVQAAKRLFTDTERRVLAGTIAATNATAELLGRARVRERWVQALRKHEPDKLAELNLAPHVELFDEPDVRLLKPLPPEKAVTYFKRLVPTIGVKNPERFGALLERKAFTLAVDADQTLLEKVKGIIQDRLETGKGISTAPAEIEELLTDAGVAPKNPQYCFLPGTLVEGAVLAASKAWYDGPAVKIETDDGRRLSVTFNHPVLTTAGWKHAGGIQEGEHLVCYGCPVESLDAADFAGNRGQLPKAAVANGCDSVRAIAAVRLPAERGAVDNQQIPARIEDVFEALRVESPMGLDVQCPSSPLDFYGDAVFFKGEVHCVRADGVLMGRADADRREFLQQVNLVHRHVPAACPSGEGRGLLSSGFERPPDAALAADELAQPLCPPLRVRRSPGTAHLIGSAANLDARFFKATEKRSRGDMQLACKLMQRLPALVSTHRVVKVEWIEWSGHVYDLQTATGFIVSQGIVTSNCEMVFRTNTRDSYQQGLEEELKDPDVVDVFPVWKYLGIRDGRQGEDHEPHFDNYYPNDASFREVRGERVFNCRCDQQPIDKWLWKELQAKGARVSTFAERK